MVWTDSDNGIYGKDNELDSPVGNYGSDVLLLSSSVELWAKFSGPSDERLVESILVLTNPYTQYDRMFAFLDTYTYTYLNMLCPIQNKVDVTNCTINRLS